MSVRDRVLALLHDEEYRLLELLEQAQAELAEVRLLRDVLREESGVETGAEDPGNVDVELPRVEQRFRPGEGPERMKQIGAENSAAIIKALAYGGAGSVNDVAAATGITRPTVQTHLKALYDEGRVSRRLGDSNGHRRPYVYELVSVVEEREHALDIRTNVLDH